MTSLRLNEGKVLEKPLWLCEYDLPTESKYLKKDDNKTIRALRNKIIFVLKFKLHAQQNLQSSWFISEEKISLAETLLTEIIEDFTPKLPDKFNLYNRIKLIPIYVTKEGYEHYENKKVEFILQFIGENTELMVKGIKKRRMNEGNLWKAKKCVEIYNVLKNDLKDHKRYTEIEEAIINLEDLIVQFEQIKVEEKNKRAKKQ